jgi:hypothetical protein
MVFCICRSPYKAFFLLWILSWRRAFVKACVGAAASVCPDKTVVLYNFARKNFTEIAVDFFNFFCDNFTRGKNIEINFSSTNDVNFEFILFLSAVWRKSRCG